MAIVDYNLLMSDNQDLAQAIATYLSTHSIDLWAGNSSMPSMPNPGGKPVSDPGRGVPVEVWAQVTESFTTADDGKIFAELVMADNEALTSNLVVLQTSLTLTAAQAVAGKQFSLRCLPGGITKRYLGIRWNIIDHAMTAGKCSAGIVLDRQSNPTL